MGQDATRSLAGARKSVLWWGRFDPDYSRNRILRAQFSRLGWGIGDFRPRISMLGDLEAQVRRLPVPDLVWVPCFRQRDLGAASRWAAAHRVPLAFDPLISAYDKQVDERGKWDANSRHARRILARERSLFQRADLVLADTPAHADYFAQVLGVERHRLAVVYVGAEETLFTPHGLSPPAPGAPLEALFYGSFLPLQGPDVVIEAAKLYQGPPVQWTLLGQGPLRRSCEEQAKGLANVRFEAWLPYPMLPDRIQKAQILLGVFGTTPKAGRVIPNKVYQSLACGRVVVTREAAAYPAELRGVDDSGLVWIPAGDAPSLANQVAALARSPPRLQELASSAAETSRRYFSESAVRHQLSAALQGLSLPPASSPA